MKSILIEEVKETMEKTPVNRPRDIGFDVLRGIGIIFMVMGHVGFGDHFLHYIYGFHMPVFFFVSGVFYNDKKYDRYTKHLLHDVRTLLVPYTVFFLLCQILHWIYTHHYSFQYAALSYFTSNHNRIDVAGGYWFLLCMFSARQIFYGICRIQHQWMRWCIVIAFAFIGPLFNNQIAIHLPLCLDSALSSIPIMYLGFILRRNNQSMLKKIQKLPLIFTILALLFNGFLIMQNGIVMVRGNHYGIVPFYWFNCVCAILIWWRFSGFIVESQSGILKVFRSTVGYIGQNSMAYLVFNEIMIFAMGTLLNVLNLSQFLEGYMGNTVIFLLSILSITLINEALHKLKLQWILGK